MKTKTKNIIGWVLTGLLTVVFLGSAYGKFTASDDIIRQAALMGFSPVGIKLLGVLEVLCFFLFVIPRTGGLSNCFSLDGIINICVKSQQSLSC